MDEASVPAIFATDLPQPKPRTFALVVEGIVTKVGQSFDHLRHPFGDDAKGHTVLDVTGVTCAVGYVADHKGNVAPDHGGGALLPHEPAYHDRSTPPAAHIMDTVAVTQGDAPVIAEDHTDHGDLATDHPVAPYVQEHGVVQGETRPDEVPPTETRPDA